MSWFKNLLPSRIRTSTSSKKGVPEGLWTKCLSCSAILYRTDLERNLLVCPKCGHHHRMPARARLDALFDDGFTEIGDNILTVDHLKFKDSKKYKERIASAIKKTDEKEALIMGHGTLHNMGVVAGAMEFAFMGGSMGSAVGERFVQGANVAIEKKIPFIVFSASGGARMQEGLISLFQMAKTSAAVKRLSQLQLPFISVLTDPTMGGVAASFSMLGDIIIAEPGAMVGFAGPRVIEQTVREVLPEGFQRSEFLMEHGAIDCIIDRREQRYQIARLLAKLLQLPTPTQAPEPEQQGNMS